MSGNRKIRIIYVVIFLFSIFIILFGANLYQYNKENQYVYQNLNSKLDPQATDLQKVIVLTELIYKLKGENTKSGGLEPVGYIINEGGDCSDRSRTLIAALALEGISAKRTALYRDSLEGPVHANVQIDLNGTEIIADPLFNIVFNNGTHFVDKFELMKGNYDLGNSAFWYEDALHDIRSERWNDLKIGTWMYNLLQKKIGERFVRNLARPYFMERYFLFRSYIFLSLAIFTLILLILVQSKFSFKPFR